MIIKEGLFGGGPKSVGRRKEKGDGEINIIEIHYIYYIYV
jgi:hypothetical protein